VSIVHYGAYVAKEDREEMTHEVCFSFCRTVPDMNFFGIKNGRECYCMTYYQAMADDDSICDEVCDGNPGTMCGGKSKSSIFGMHTCDNTAEKAADAKGRMSELQGQMMDLQGNVSFISDHMQGTASAWMSLFGHAGDVGASQLMQTANEFSSELGKAADAASKISARMSSLNASANNVSTVDLTDGSKMKQVDGLLDAMGQANTQSAAAIEELETLAEAAPNATDAANASSKYYPIMYFVDKSFLGMPTTCTGTAAEKPMIGTMDTCARACDADVHECVGFSYFPGAGNQTELGLCFLMSKFKTAKYWTGCTVAAEGATANASNASNASSAFLQHEASVDHRSGNSSVNSGDVQCVVKFAEFEGTTLKPDPSGKCSLCLKEATKANRCFFA